MTWARLARKAPGWLVALAAVGLTLVMDLARIDQARALTRLPGRADTGPAWTPPGPTGYPNRQREWIPLDRDDDAFEWIATTQRMLARRELRVRWCEDENAPVGRPVRATSPYRWWLGLVAEVDHLVSGCPPGRAVEQAAWVADPLLHVLAVAAAALFAGWKWGARGAAIAAAGLGALYPLAAEFPAGLPGSRGLAILSAFFAMLLLAVAWHRSAERAAAPRGRHVSRWLFLSGVAGAACLWVDATLGGPLILGMAAGAVAGAVVLWRRLQRLTDAAIGWRWWSLGGATTVLLACLAEYAPDHLGGWRFDVIHPLYGLIWIGLGELLVWSCRTQKQPGNPRPAAPWRLLLAACVVAALFVALQCGEDAIFPGRSLDWLQLAPFPGSPAVEGGVGAWLIRDGVSGRFWAAVAPVAVIAAAAGRLLFGRRVNPEQRYALAVVLMPAVGALTLAAGSLGWLAPGEALSVVVVIVASDGSMTGWTRAIGGTALLLALTLGLVQLWPPRSPGAARTLTQAQAELLIERDLAHWLARHARYQPAVVYAPPAQTSSLVFYGGFRGLGTLARDNQPALATTLKIAGAGSVEEVRQLLEERRIRYVVLPSWDAFFDDYHRLYAARNGTPWREFFLPALRDWRMSPWMRALPYVAPAIAGFPQYAMQVFEIGEAQTPAVSASRLTECLIALGQSELLPRAIAVLGRFPADVGALTARAQAEFALNGTRPEAATVAMLVRRVKAGGDRYLPWDRRVSLAIVLVRSEQVDLARQEVDRCLEQIDADQLPSMPPGEIYNFLVLVRAFGREITDASVRARMLELLTPELRARLR